MIYISTDYVFNGQGETPWTPDCKDYAPLNVYGETKLAGEFAVAQTLEKYFIVRIAWVFGLNGKNFIKTMLNVGKSHSQLKVCLLYTSADCFCGDFACGIVDYDWCYYLYQCSRTKEGNRYFACDRCLKEKYFTGI